MFKKVNLKMNEVALIFKSNKTTIKTGHYFKSLFPTSDKVEVYDVSRKYLDCALPIDDKVQYNLRIFFDVQYNDLESLKKDLMSSQFSCETGTINLDFLKPRIEILIKDTIREIAPYSESYSRIFIDCVVNKIIERYNSEWNDSKGSIFIQEIQVLKNSLDNKENKDFVIDIKPQFTIKGTEKESVPEVDF